MMGGSCTIEVSAALRVESGLPLKLAMLSEEAVIVLTVGSGLPLMEGAVAAVLSMEGHRLTPSVCEVGGEHPCASEGTKGAQGDDCGAALDPNMAHMQIQRVFGRCTKRWGERKDIENGLQYLLYTLSKC